MQISNGRFVVVDFINLKKLLIVFSGYSKTFDGKLIIKDIIAMSIWL